MTGTRYFAIKRNNQAWSLSVKKCSLEEDAEMLNLVHAAVFHWQAISIELNCMRAKTLWAEVHPAICNGVLAFA